MTIDFFVSDALKDGLDRIVEKTGSSKAQVVRDALGALKDYNEHKNEMQCDLWYEKQDESGLKIEAAAPEIDYIPLKKVHRITLPENQKFRSDLRQYAKTYGKRMAQVLRDAVTYLVRYVDKLDEGYKLYSLKKGEDISKKVGVVLIGYHDLNKT